jgi:Ca-activated chloride channel family protein
MARRRKCFRAGGVFAVIVSAMAGAWPGGAQNRVALDVATFRADSTLVLVPVTVVDRRGAIVNGLTRDAFTLFEDGAPQEIRSLSEEDAPVSIGIVLDLSGSMKRVLGTAKESLMNLLNDANPGDEAFLNGVSTRPLAYSGFTRDFGGILDRVAFEDAGGDTALVDTIYDSLRELRSGVHPRKALLVISDGMDNHSRYSRGELLERAVESDAQIYTVAAGGAAPPYSKPIELTEEKRGLLFLDELAAKTGGMSFIVRDRSDIAKAAASVARALRNQYTIGYAPRDDGSGGKWRKIKVKVAGSGMRAYARTGYRLD